MFSLDAALPQVSDKMKDKEIIRKDMKESSNSVFRFAGILKTSN